MTGGGSRGPNARLFAHLRLLDLVYPQTQEVVEHLLQLKASLESTIDEEERLKHQAHSVQRLAKVDRADIVHLLVVDW